MTEQAPKVDPDAVEGGTLRYDTISKAIKSDPSPRKQLRDALLRISVLEVERNDLKRRLDRFNAMSTEQAEIRRLRACLKRLEWLGAAGWDDDLRECKACGQWESQGHREDCFLAAALKEGE